jgi:hypothetical protein
MSFKVFKAAVAAQFERMRGKELFRTKIERNDVWDIYLTAFPQGSNPIFRQRTEHDCSCCRQFIKAIGNVVAIDDGKLVSIWDVLWDENPGPYGEVARVLAEAVKMHPIDNRFLTTERVAGTDKNFEEIAGSNVKTWEHFFVNIPRQFVCDGPAIGPQLSDAQALHDVLFRSLQDISIESVDTVLELIAQGSLYRGDQYVYMLQLFLGLLHKCGNDAWVWSKISRLPPEVCKIRNTSIGTLLLDLSNGVELEQAVRKFEAMVAPTNYKRPTALVTPSMVASAREKLQDLGMLSALERRYARLTDVGVHNALFVNRNLKVGGDIFDELSRGGTSKIGHVEEITIDKFLGDVLPRARTVEVLMEPRLTGNLVSLIAPIDPTSERMFKWTNKISWSYNGDLADSIKERVKKAGGNVTGDLCCRLSWSNYDDLDLHMIEPGGQEIYFHNKRSRTGGCLDVDMNAGTGQTREPVENIFYADEHTMREGVYQLFVHQFLGRETTDVGFEVEIDYKGQVWHFQYPKRLATKSKVLVTTFNYSHKQGVTGIDLPTSRGPGKKVWGVTTNTFVPVNVMCLSPNQWGGAGAVGPLHYFFMLDGCVNEGTARGFYNEFLRPELDVHRKVMEMVGSKVRTETSQNQLSGLGFSSTIRNSLTVRVAGAFTRILKINF